MNFFFLNFRLILKKYLRKLKNNFEEIVENFQSNFRKLFMIIVGGGGGFAANHMLPHNYFPGSSEVGT